MILDLFNREVVGWSMKPHMRQDLVVDALRMAWFRRYPEPGLSMHSDRGSRYCSKAFTEAIKAYGMRASMSRKGDCWDNAPTESLWGSLKVGRLHGMRFVTRRAAMDEVVDWLTFYNHHRLHSTLGKVRQLDAIRAGMACRPYKAGGMRSRIRGPGKEGEVSQQRHRVCVDQQKEHAGASDRTAVGVQGNGSRWMDSVWRCRRDWISGRGVSNGLNGWFVLNKQAINAKGGATR